jgi:hypothetical protein
MGDPEGQNRLSKALIAKILFPEELAQVFAYFLVQTQAPGGNSLI